MKGWSRPIADCRFQSRDGFLLTTGGDDEEIGWNSAPADSRRAGLRFAGMMEGEEDEGDGQRGDRIAFQSLMKKSWFVFGFQDHSSFV